MKKEERWKPNKEEMQKYTINKLYNSYIIFSLMIMVFEVIMMIRGGIVFDFNDIKFIVYMASYAVLGICSLLGAIILFNQRNSKEEHYKKIRNLVFAYIIVILLWSILISFLDMAEGGFPIVYLTVLMAISAIGGVNPKTFFAMTIISFAGLMIPYRIVYGKVDPGLCFNLVVYLASVIFIACQVNKSYIQEISSHKKYEYLSYRDQLTNLFNRRRLDQKAIEYYREGKRYILIMMDIDNFKALNDTYGHQLGDLCLKEVSIILTSIFGDNCYRYGGDEIAIFSVENMEDTKEKLDRFIHELKERKTSIPLSASIGIYENKECEKPQDVFIKSDEALYCAKNKQKGSYHIYS